MRTSLLLRVLSRCVMPETSRRSVTGCCLTDSAGTCFCTGLVTIFWMGELFPTPLIFMAISAEELLVLLPALILWYRLEGLWGLKGRGQGGVKRKWRLRNDLR